RRTSVTSETSSKIHGSLADEYLKVSEVWGARSLAHCQRRAHRGPAGGNRPRTGRDAGHIVNQPLESETRHGGSSRQPTARPVHILGRRSNARPCAAASCRGDPRSSY